MGLAASRQEAFWEACGFGNVLRVKKFLQDGDVDVNWVSYTNDCCPIHVASQGKPEIVKLLIDAKCDVNVIDARGNLALHHAAMKGHADIVQTLINAGSEVNVQEKNGWTPLHNAAYWCRPDAVRVLLKNGCNVHIENKDHRTPLHELARSQQTDDAELGEIAQLLIDAGSDINAKSSNLGEADLTGLMYAAYHNHPDVVTALVDAGCELNAIGTTFWTALHWAAERGHDEVVYTLLEADADPTKKGMRGETAADRAQTDIIRDILNTAMKLKHDMDRADPNLLNVLSTRSMQQSKPGPKYVPKCDAGFKSQSFLPKDWKPRGTNVENMFIEKKTELSIKAAKQEQNEKLWAQKILDTDFSEGWEQDSNEEDSEADTQGSVVDQNTENSADDTNENGRNNTIHTNENGMVESNECQESHEDESKEVVGNTQTEAPVEKVVCNGDCVDVDIDVQVDGGNERVNTSEESDNNEVSVSDVNNKHVEDGSVDRVEPEDQSDISDCLVDKLKLGEPPMVITVTVGSD